MLRLLSLTAILTMIAMSHSSIAHAKTCSAVYAKTLQLCNDRFQSDAAKLKDCKARQKASHKKCLITGTFTYRTAPPTHGLTKK